MKDNRWISIAGHKQKVSELAPDLRKRLGIEDLPEEEKVERKRVHEPKEIRVSNVRYTTPYNQKKIESERREYRKSPDSGMDIIAKFIGRAAGRAWVRFTR